MLNVIQQRLALSPKGARDFLKGTFFTALLDITLMLPAVYVFLFLDDYLRSALLASGAVHNGMVYYAAIGLAFMAVTFFIALLQYENTYTVVYDESANRRIGLAEKLRKLPLAFFGEKDLSDLTSTIMTDNTELEHTFSHAVPQLFASVATILLIMLGLFAFEWRMATALFWVVPVAASVLLVSKQWQRKGHKAVYDMKRSVSEHIQEGLETIHEIKAYGNEAMYHDALNEKLAAHERNLTRVELTLGVLVNGAQSILKLGLASVIILGAHLVAGGTVDLFTYLIFLIIGSRIYEPINEVFNNLAALFYLDVRIDRMNEIEALPTQQGETRDELEQFNIVFEGVNFSYEDNKQVMQDVSFTAQQGRITALVGPSGGGKSTSAKLAARFWDADSGTISLGGQDIRTIDPESLLQHYSVVFQDVVLFNATVMENIRIGKNGASDEEVLRVAKLARCDEFVSTMPDGYHTLIGENGSKLSGGERQRISIARALLKDAPVILLDEATASLDVENETRIQAGIMELIRGKTVLIIAHRMRTVANADHVVVLKNGRVVEQGPPAELKRNPDGIFAGMLERQQLAAKDTV